MKIRIINKDYKLIYNEEFDAAVSPNKKYAAMYDSYNSVYYLNENDFQIIDEKNNNYEFTETSTYFSLVDAIGEKPKRIEIEF